MIPIKNYLVIFTVLSLTIFACGGSDEDDNENGDSTLTLTSSADDDGFDPGDTIPDQYACEDVGGENRIPKITWSGVPDEAQSLALVVIDLTADANSTVHSIIINLDPSTTSISNDSDLSSDQVVVDYLGPCPVGHTETHTYEATLYTLNVPEITVEDASDTDAVIEDIQDASIDSDSIQGIFLNQ